MAWAWQSCASFWTDGLERESNLSWSRDGRWRDKLFNENGDGGFGERAVIAEQGFPFDPRVDGGREGELLHDDLGG